MAILHLLSMGRLTGQMHQKELYKQGMERGMEWKIFRAIFGRLFLYLTLLAIAH